MFVTPYKLIKTLQIENTEFIFLSKKNQQFFE